MSLETETVLAPAPVAGAARLLLPGFAATLFVGACLLFLVQPMVSRMILPYLGGSPGVWNTCMCFFQAELLLGYAYAHWLATRVPEGSQAAIHTAVLAIAALFLPLDLTAQVPPADASPVLWLIGRLSVTVGPPFFAISATAPLLQRWFARTEHHSAQDPYFLYAASNAGSLLALLAYPLVVEPQLSLSQQSLGWSCGLGLLAIGIAICWVGYRNSAMPAAIGEVGPRPAVADRLRWVAYAFVPSSLLLAVTAHITTDIGAAPLFWVIPLALYLVTFTLTFARRALLPHRLMRRLQPLMIIPVVILSVGIHSLWLLLVHLGCFFVTAMVCHGELARSRPPVRNLTEFYLWVSLGGVLGGIFVALLAPLLFPDVWEYPLLLIAACALRPAARQDGGSANRADLLLPALLLAGLLTLVYLGRLPNWLVLAAGVLAAVALVYFSERRWRFALGVAGCLLAGQLVASGETVATERSFFGVNRVRLMQDGAITVLQHGTTIHGAESTRPGEEDNPLGYYSREGPFGSFFNAVADRKLSRIGVIGLGSGALACYARPGQSWTFHELDPAVAKLASDGRFFHFLAHCGDHPRIVLGDARLTLHDVPDHLYDVIVVDAFNSDSIPLHLMTREALALYQRKLAPDGVVLFHISNRYLDLAPVIAALARDAGAPVRDLLYLPPDANALEHLGTEVAAVGQPGHDLDFLTAEAGWRPLEDPSAAALWTDQRAAIVSRIKWR